MLVSFLGDSISTYSGFNPEGYAVFYDAEMQKRNGLNSVYDTWWAKVNQELRAYLCVNNSYSGSRVSGRDFPAGCCPERIMHLHTPKYMPNLILIYLGFNDFGYGVPISCAPQSNDGKINITYFEDAYHQMLTGLRYFYPDAKIVCATLMKTMLKQNTYWRFFEKLGGISIDDYNNLSRVQLFVTPWTAAYQAPPSMGFSRQEYWSGVPSPCLFNFIKKFFSIVLLSLWVLSSPTRK